MYYKGVDKMYEKIKKFIKENGKTIIIFLGLYLVLSYPLPYYIYAGGGTIDISKRINISSNKKKDYKMYFAYVKELKGNTATYLLAKVIKDWDLEKEEDIKLNKDETIEDISIRDHISLKNANQTAILMAYKKAGKKVNIKACHPYIVYIEKKEKDGVRIGDEIIKVEDNDYKDISTLKNIIESRKVGDKIKLLVKRNNKEKEIFATVKKEQDKKIIGISINNIYDYETEPKIELKFKQSESGPSGGLMLTLAIYNNLVAKDITNGKKIVGTGTIDENGNVGSIGGVKYKLNGAVRSKADIFLVPSGENYEEAVKEAKRKKYSIKIVSVSTFDEALKKITQ